MLHRDNGCRLLRGKGIEVGALHAPAGISPLLEVEYCDVIDAETAASLFPELEAWRLVRPARVFNLDEDGLAAYADASQDFVIANMVIAHLANPISFIAEIFRVVRPGGHFVLSAADKQFTYDAGRESTTFDAMLKAYEDGALEIDDATYFSMLEAVDVGQVRGPARRVAQAVARARSRREAVHVWNSHEFSQFLVQCMAHLRVRARCVYERSGEETGIEYFSVWEVCGADPGSIELSPGITPVVADAPDIAESGHGALTAAVHAGNQTATGVRQTTRIAGQQASGAGSPDLASGQQGANVLLLGMHRSGTSLSARLLGDTGLWLGDDEDFLPPHPQDNPDGYWERSDVYAAHAGFLDAVGMDWDRLAGLSDELLRGVHGDTLRSALAGLIERLDLHSPWLVKDPRLGLLLPAWHAAGARFVPVVVVRHPLEIAGSLAASPRGTYPIPHLLALWEKYLKRALSGLAGQPAVFLSYRRLLAEPVDELQRVTRLLTGLGVRGLTVPDTAQLAQRIKPGLYRQRAEGDPDGLMTRAQAELWERLAAAAEVDSAVALEIESAEPDAQLASFEAAYDSRIAIGRHLAADDTSRQVAEIRQTTATILEQLRAQQTELRAQNERLGEQCENLRATELDLRERLSHALLDNRHLRAEAQQAAAREQVLSTERAFNAEAVQAMRSSLSWRITSPLRWLAGRVRAPRLSWRMEQRLHRWYYGFPGISYRRKRSLVLWVHKRLPFLTRSTQSFNLYRQGAARPGDAPLVPRMDATRAAALIAGMARKPRFSIIMPVYNTDRRWLEDAIESLKAQYYDNWELCIVDDCSNKAETLEYLAQLDDPRIRQQRMETNAGIARTTNAALALATGDYIGLLDHDDVLTRDALLENALVLQDTSIDLVYSDEDKMDVDGDCHGPVYKPDYSPDYLFSNNYFCHFTVVARSLVEAVGGLHYGYDGAQDFDLVLRLTEKARTVHHIPKVLYHWRMVPSSTAATAGAKPYTWEAGRRALTDALDRRGIAGRVDLGPYPNTYHVRRDILAEHLVSIVVPFREEPDLLERCVTSILEKSTWTRFELVLVDNQSASARMAELLAQLSQRDSRVRVLRYDQPFNYSALHNWVVPQLEGDMLLVLNNDTEVISPDWIESLVEHAQRPEVGVVGCRLLYADETVQHGGVIVGIGSFAGHAHHLIPAEHPGYMAKPHLLQNVSAVTFACAMMRMQLYRDLGGLDATNLGVAYNDVDFCLRALEKGYLNVYTPHAELYHHESRTRGSEDDAAKKARFAAETAYMRHRHRDLLKRGDPFYNINFRSDGDSYEIDPQYTATLPV
jgi:glycosyltransferase involved in cell wall biosynthesis/SAM-dependent methyltransferase